jgi:dihydroflavonol-4-reductase
MATLITGAAGFVGSHVTRFLVKKANNIRVLVRPTSQLRFIQDLPVEFVQGDLRDRASLAKAVRGATHVFHIAADYRLWSRKPDEIYAANVTGTRNLLEAAREAGVERFVYTSTVGTIAIPGLPDENTKAGLDDMIGHYKRSKLLAEQEVLKAASSGFPAVIVNPTTPVGPGDWKPTPTGKIILDFLNRRMPAYVDTGMNLVAVEDVAVGHWLAAQHGRSGQRYIIGARNMTLKQMLDAIAAAVGQPAPRIRLPYLAALAAGHAENLFCSITGREPRIPLEGVRMARHKMFVEAALQRAARWYIENGYVRAAGIGAKGQGQAKNARFVRGTSV